MELIGQERAQAALRRAGAGSVLIVGPDGVGRFGLAVEAARAVLGTDAAAAARVDSLQHVDLGVLDPTEGIEGVRRATERLSRLPVEGPRQVLILRDLDRMSHEAHNALLKTLEEPPAGAAIFAIAEALHHLPETVVSRCRVVRARRLGVEETERVLRPLGVPTAWAADAEGSPGRAVFLHEHGVGESAEELLRLLRGSAADPLGIAETLGKRRTDESAGEHRHRLSEVLRVAATRLRASLPEQEEPLRDVVDALGSLSANANPAIVLTDLAVRAELTPR